MGRKLLFCCCVVGMCVSCAVTPPKKSPPPQPPTVRYLALLQAGVARAREQMPAIIESADRAAQRVTSGGKLYVAGSQPDFSPELLHRAGGLMGLAPLPAKMIEINRSDVVLYAARSALTIEDQARISRLRDAGGFVVAFASTAQSPVDFRPDVLIDSGAASGER